MQAEDVVRVSTKGQVVIPKAVRQRFGIVPGKKLLVAAGENEIVLKKIEDISLGDLSRRLSKEATRAKLDIDAVVEEAVEWARK